jgi:hypothetical protein
MHIKRKAKVNISPKMYDQIVNEIEHDPLIKRSTLVIAGLLSFIAVLFGLLIWYAPMHPAKLVRTNGTVMNLNSGKTDTQGTVTTFITFSFAASDGRKVSVKAPITSKYTGYRVGDSLLVGYSPLNPNYARNLSHILPPRLSIVLWAAPFVMFFWFGVVALARHHTRQEEIFFAAEAAGIKE